MAGLFQKFVKPLVYNPRPSISELAFRNLAIEIQKHLQVCIILITILEHARHPGNFIPDKGSYLPASMLSNYVRREFSLAICMTAGGMTSIRQFCKDLCGNRRSFFFEGAKRVVIFW